MGHKIFTLCIKIYKHRICTKMKRCSICLDKVIFVPFALINKITGARKLLCGHVYHDECVRKLHKLKCPLCSYPILSGEEEMLLNVYSDNSYSPSYTIYLLKTSNINVSTVYTICLRNIKKYRNLINLMYIYCDFTQVLFENLCNYDIVKLLIINKTNINWFKTFNGRTFFDLVIDNVNDARIVDMVLNDNLISLYYPAVPQ
jgi:hypothetical protein